MLLINAVHEILLILGRNQLKGVLDDLVSQVKEEK